MHLVKYISLTPLRFHLMVILNEDASNAISTT
jgi:hypothetical protein